MTEPPVICPRCEERPVDAGRSICTPCQLEEEEEARSGSVDAGTERQARQENAQQRAEKLRNRDQEQKPATDEKPAEKSEAKPAAKKPTNGTQPKPAPAAQPAPAAAKKMSLANVTAGFEDLPYKLVVFGPIGVGKTSFAADAPDPVFIPVERSVNLTANKFPQPENWMELVEALTEVERSAHKFKTLVIDTVDRAEPMAWRLCVEEEREKLSGQPAKARRIRSIEDVGGGFKKGYVAAAGKFRFLISRLDRIVAARKMNIILLAHAQVKTFNNPEGENYDRWEMKLSTQRDANVVAILNEWCDALLFANYRTTVATDSKGRSTKKGDSDGKRYIYTSRTAAFDAKNRYDLPHELQMPVIDQFGTFDRAVQANRNPEALAKFIDEKLKAIGDPEIESWVKGQLEKKPNVQLLSRINIRLAERLELMEAAAQNKGDDAEQEAGDA